MGCDIHVVLERHWKGQWVGMDNHQSGRACERNYERFDKLAGVRGDGDIGVFPLGLPGDVSLLAEMLHEEWRDDAHSSSWYPLQDFVRICLETERDPENVFLKPNDPRQEPYYYYFGLYVDEDDFNLDDYRVVFWFDN